MNVVLIVHIAAERIGTVREHVAALTRLTRHHVVKIDNSVAASVSFALFDVMVLHYSLMIANPYYSFRPPEGLGPPDPWRAFGRRRWLLPALETLALALACPAAALRCSTIVPRCDAAGADDPLLRRGLRHVSHPCGGAGRASSWGLEAVPFCRLADRTSRPGRVWQRACPTRRVGLAHRRLAIIDLSGAC